MKEHTGISRKMETLGRRKIILKMCVCFVCLGKGRERMRWRSSEGNTEYSQLVEERKYCTQMRGAVKDVKGRIRKMFHASEMGSGASSSVVNGEI